MKQALHIFRKDVRGLWPQIVGVAGLLALYGVFPPASPGITTLAEWGNLLPALTLIACWVLGGFVVHQDTPADDAQFWLTRPYDRSSLLLAKVFFLFIFVYLPLVFFGFILEARSGVSLTANAGSLMLLDLGRSVWLILPALAVGAATRDLKGLAGGLGVLGLTLLGCATYSSRHWIDGYSAAQIPYFTNIAGVLPMVLASLAAVAIQYGGRKTQQSRTLLATGVIASGLLLPLNGVALLSTRAMNPGFDPDRVRISFDEKSPTLYERDFTGYGRGCFSVALKVEGLPAGAILRPFGSPRVYVESPFVLSSMPKTQEAQLLFEQNAEGYREVVCSAFVPRNADAPATIRASLNFAVFSVAEIARIPAQVGTFTADGAGVCELITRFPNELRCDLTEPVLGSISAGLEFGGYKDYSENLVPNATFRLTSVSRQRFDGFSSAISGVWPIDEALAHPEARFVLRTERIIGFVRRDLVYGGITFPWLRRERIKQ